MFEETILNSKLSDLNLLHYQTTQKGQILLPNEMKNRLSERFCFPRAKFKFIQILNLGGGRSPLIEIQFPTF